MSSPLPTRQRPALALGLALVSIFLWASLAALAQKLSHVPPFLLVAVAFGIGALPSLRNAKTWVNYPVPLLLGTVGLFGYHLLLFLALRLAPPVEANLLNYTWPILIVFFSAWLLPNYRLQPHHIIGGALAFVGAGIVIARGAALSFSPESLTGYACALGAAFVWAIYSVLTKRMAHFPTTVVGGFCLLSSGLALAAHWGFEPSVSLSPQDFMLLVLLGCGPMGIAFYTWDASLKTGDPRIIGALSYLTPLLSTCLLTLSNRTFVFTGAVAASLALIVGGAAVSSWDVIFPKQRLV